MRVKRNVLLLVLAGVLARVGIIDLSAFLRPHLGGKEEAFVLIGWT